MQFNIQTILNYLLIILALITGLVAGAIASRMVALSLGTVQQQAAPSDAVAAIVRRPQEEDLQIILQRSLFDMSAVGSSLERIDLSGPSAAGDEEAEGTSPRAVNVDLDKYTLLGTVVAGADSLAVIQSGAEVHVYRIDSELESGIRVTRIERRRVVLQTDSGRHDLTLEELETDTPAAAQTVNRRPSSRSAGGASAQASAAGNIDAGVEEIGDGRYRVDRAMVENARANMGTLLQSARMIPHLENDQTVGFRLVGMQRGSLLEQLGLKLGDVVMEINRIKLDSPEKALQIFQQVREANNISIGLVRDGQPQTFEYSLN